MQRSSSRPRKSDLWFLLLAGFVCYGVSLWHPFLWDDEVTVVGNTLIRDFRNLPIVFTSGYHAGGGDLSNLYRPLAVISFMSDYAIWGLKPFGFHLTNLILHLLNGVTKKNCIFRPSVTPSPVSAPTIIWGSIISVKGRATKRRNISIAR